MRSKWIGLVAACAVVAAWGATVQADPPPPTLWSQQICSGSWDFASGIAADVSGNVYVAGRTRGDLGGPNQGSYDAFVVKYDTGGTVQWIRQIGTGDWDNASGVAVDGGGNSYITGYTSGDLGGPNQGEADVFLAAWDSAGTVQWIRQIGNSLADYANDIALDGSGNIYITGRTEGDLGGPSQGDYDVFVAKYDTGGTLQWTRQIGTSGWDAGHAIAVDGSGNSYITGSTWGDLGDPNQGADDVFICKYDTGGTWQWTRQFGSSSNDNAQSIAIDASGNIYIAGDTYGELGGPSQFGDDAFLAKLDSSGTVQWIQQSGDGHNQPHFYKGVAVDSNGSAYVTGEASPRTLLAKYGGDGTEQWKRQVCPHPVDVAVDAGGTVYVTGSDLVGGCAHVVAVASYPATVGDATLDGCVDGLDYIAWSNNYKLSDRWWEEGDFTGDGYVDGLDYVVWSSNYDVGCPAAPGPVPEPSCAVLLALGFLALRRRFGA